MQLRIRWNRTAKGISVGVATISIVNPGGDDFFAGTFDMDTDLLFEIPGTMANLTAVETKEELVMPDIKTIHVKEVQSGE